MSGWTPWEGRLSSLIIWHSSPAYFAMLMFVDLAYSHRSPSYLRSLKRMLDYLRSLGTLNEWLGDLVAIVAVVVVIAELLYLPAIIGCLFW